MSITLGKKGRQENLMDALIQQTCPNGSLKVAKLIQHPTCLFVDFNFQTSLVVAERAEDKGEGP